MSRHPQGLALAIVAVPLPLKLISIIQRLSETSRSRRASNPLREDGPGTSEEAEAIIRALHFLLRGVLAEDRRLRMAKASDFVTRFASLIRQREVLGHAVGGILPKIL